MGPECITILPLTGDDSELHVLKKKMEMHLLAFFLNPANQ